MGNRGTLSTVGYVSILALIWGSSFILMKLGLYTPEGDPMFSWDQVAAARLFFASIVLIPVVWKYREMLTGPHAKHLLLVGLIGNGIPAFLFAGAEVKLDSSLTGMLNALVPLFTLIVAVFAFKTQVKFLNVIGILIGLGGAIGLSTIKGLSVFGEEWPYISCVVVATFCYAMSVNFIKNYLHDVPPIAITALGLAYFAPLAGVYLFFATDFAQQATSTSYGLEAVGYLIILGVVGTSFALILFNRFVKQTTAIFASTITYLIPIVAIFWGKVFGEGIGSKHYIYMSVILAGVYLVNKKPRTLLPSK